MDEPWYLSINNAEKYAFFHGCIRFLYRDASGNPNWDNFDTKWENAKLFFDEKGIKSDYRTRLTRYLVYGVFNSGRIWDKIFGGHSYFFNVNAESWLNNVLKQSDWRQRIVHSILISEDLPNLQWPNPADDSEYLKSLYALFSNDDFPWDFIINTMPTARFTMYPEYSPEKHYCFYCRWNNSIFMDCGKWKRNEILRQLANHPNFEIITKNPINNDILFHGYVIEIKYMNHRFQWTPEGNYNQSCIKYNDRSLINEIDSVNKLQEVLNKLLDES